MQSDEVTENVRVLYAIQILNEQLSNNARFKRMARESMANLSKYETERERLLGERRLLALRLIELSKQRSNKTEQ